IRDLDSVRERVVRADHAVHVVIRQGDVAGILNLHRRAHGPLINESLPASHFTPRARGLMPFVYTPNPIMMFVPPLGANTIGMGLPILPGERQEDRGHLRASRHHQPGERSPRRSRRFWKRAPGGKSWPAGSSICPAVPRTLRATSTLSTPTGSGSTNGPPPRASFR